MRFEPITIPWTVLRACGAAQPTTPWYRVAPVTLAFVATYVAVFAVILLAGEDAGGTIASALAMSPEVFIVEPWRLLTCGLVHTSWVQLWPSCVFVLLMGAALEVEIGSVAMLQVMVFSTIAGAFTCAVLTLSGCWGASLAMGGILAALVALPRHRGDRHLVSPRTWWPLLVLVLVHVMLAEEDYSGYGGYLGCFGVGLIYGAAHRPGRPPDIRRAIKRACQAVAWLAMRLGDHRLPG